ncbi:MAG: GPW/gp25 family protein [Syntrophomonas sp.]
MNNSFMGRGWKFPVEVDQATGRIKMSEGEEDIRESIRIILGTSKGERMMRPEFGCELKDFVFGITDVTTLRLLENKIKDSIMIWEPRVEEVKVNVDLDDKVPGKLNISITYMVRSTNNLFNLVYPFYINEGVG